MKFLIRRRAVDNSGIRSAEDYARYIYMLIGSKFCYVNYK